MEDKRCEHCNRILAEDDGKNYHSEAGTITMKGGKRYVATVYSNQMVCSDCYVHLKKIDKSFKIAYAIIDFILIILGYLLCFQYRVFSEGAITGFVVGLLAVPIFGNDIVKQIYLQVDSHFRSKDNK